MEVKIEKIKIIKKSVNDDDELGKLMHYTHGMQEKKKICRI